MNSTILFVVVIATIALGFILGYIKGFFRILISFGAMLLAIGIVYMITPKVSSMLESTKMYGSLYENVLNTMDNTIFKKITGEEYSQTKDDKEKQIVLDKKIYNKVEENDIIDKLELPGVVKNYMGKIYDSNNIKEKTVGNLSESISKAVSTTLLNVIIYIVLFIIVTAVIRIIVSLLDIVTRLPLINITNRLLGGIMGVAEVILIIWFIFLIIEMMKSTGSGNSIWKMIQDNSVLKYMYNNNILLLIIKKMF